MNNTKFNPQLKGVGTYAAPRGALAHWVPSKTGKKNQAVVATTCDWSPPWMPTGSTVQWKRFWIGTPVHDPEKPLEILPDHLTPMTRAWRVPRTWSTWTATNSPGVKVQ